MRYAILSEIANYFEMNKFNAEYTSIFDNVHLNILYQLIIFQRYHQTDLDKEQFM